MLRLESAGAPFNKAQRNRALRESLDGRSHGSVEFKHQNISAVLQELNVKGVVGYKPKGNYQGLLEDIVVRYLRQHPDLALSLPPADFAATPMRALDVRPLSEFLEDQPERTDRSIISERSRTYAAGKFDFPALDARRRVLGAEGESFVMWFERRRLEEAGKPRLAKGVERISESEGDGAGYDIKSFETDGTERLIEVKTTTYGKKHPFFVSINAVEFSAEFATSYHLYRLFDFSNTRRMFRLKGSLESNCHLEPTLFRAIL